MFYRFSVCLKLIICEEKTGKISANFLSLCWIESLARAFLAVVPSEYYFRGAFFCSVSALVYIYFFLWWKNKKKISCVFHFKTTIIISTTENSKKCKKKKNLNKNTKWITTTWKNFIKSNKIFVSFTIFLQIKKFQNEKDIFFRVRPFSGSNFFFSPKLQIVLLFFFFFFFLDLSLSLLRYTIKTNTILTIKYIYIHALTCVCLCELVSEWISERMDAVCQYSHTLQNKKK